MNYWTPIGLATLTLLTSLPAAATDLPAQVEQVVQHLEGTLTTADRAAQPPQPGERPAAHVVMTTCRITVPNSPPGHTFLYQEQAIFPRINKPYRQRILEISPSRLTQTVRSRSFKLIDESQWVNFCDRADKTITPSNFPESICSVYLSATTTGFSGSTQATGCPANFRGATTIRNRIELFATGMNTWDRGYNTQGKQVWGAGDEPYQFRRSTTNPQNCALDYER